MRNLRNLRQSRRLFGSILGTTLAAGVLLGATSAHAQVFSDSFATADAAKWQSQQKPGVGVAMFTTLTPDATLKMTIRTAAQESGASLPVTCTAPYHRDTIGLTAGRVFNKSIQTVTVGADYCLSGWVRGAVGSHPFMGVQETDVTSGFLVAGGANGATANSTEHWLIGDSSEVTGYGGASPNTTTFATDGAWHYVSKAFKPNFAKLLIKTENWDLTLPGQNATNDSGRAAADFDEITLTVGACPAAPTLPITNCTTSDLCDNASNTCVTCEVDNTVSPSSASKYACSSDKPFCNAGKCGKCTADTQCTTGAGHAGVFCETSSGKCLPGCANDAACGSVAWCAFRNATAGQCSSKVANGVAVPANSNGADSGVGKCTPVVGARVCLSGACDVDDNLCGLTNGKTCTAVPVVDAGVDAGVSVPNSQCRTGACQGDGKCGVTTGGTCTANGDCRSDLCTAGKCVAKSCTADTDCGSAKSGLICTANVCAEGCRGASGNGCPSDQTCSSTSATAGTCSKTVTPDGGTTTEPDSGTVVGGGDDDDDSGTPSVTPDSGTPVVNNGTGDTLEGGGISCSSTNNAGGSLLALFGIVGIAVGASVRRRRNK